jgi:hypothetical protein
MKLRDNSFLLVAIVLLIATSYLYLSVLHSHTKLVEDRGVHDDICYLRQAYLFRTQGMIGGLDTDNLSARYADSLIQKTGLKGKLSSNIPCHNLRQLTNKFVIQYPPGTGFLLSLFPEGSQASGLYIASSTTIFILLMWLIATARSPIAVGVFGALGSLTLYLMVNPAKASYSIAPTIPLCLAVAYLTVKMFSMPSSTTRIMAAASAGLLLGFATDIRLSSALLAFGHAAVFALALIRKRTWFTLAQPMAFGMSMLASTLPTLAANFVNGGSPFTTGYESAYATQLVTSRDLLVTQIQWYLFSETHSVLTWLSLLLLIALITLAIRGALTSVQPPLLVASITLAVNEVYFIALPVPSQYYTVPPAILTLWVCAFTLALWPRREETVPPNSLVRTSTTVAATTLAVGIALLAYWGMFSRPQFAPRMAIDSNAVLWIGGNSWEDAWKSNGLGLAFQYRFQRHTISGLSTLPIVDQDTVIAAVASDSRPQFIVADDQGMQEVVARLTKTGTVSFAGKALGADIYRVGN